MKKLDHNEAVKALKEGKVIEIVDLLRGVPNVKYRLGKYSSLECFSDVDQEWIKATGDSFVRAQYFTLEEPEEEKPKEIINVVYPLPKEVISMVYNSHGINFGSFSNVDWDSLRFFLVRLLKELDKRYQKKTT